MIVRKFEFRTTLDLAKQYNPCMSFLFTYEINFISNSFHSKSFDSNLISKFISILIILIKSVIYE